MTEDRELVALLKAGNVDALEQLIMRWRSRAETYAVSILHDPHTAEDAVQEAFPGSMLLGQVLMRGDLSRLIYI